ncbi:Cytochrome P450 4g15 [Eumeta japonica]|uniref:Cytochrome P450 4g15 n=1 Tax=Eumeta variegata TaxID=151549 RepID=A0A4C2A9Y5_EUMVA|nr:Cytochrome P450 4g15 [Eumeta japonica]
MADEFNIHNKIDIVQLGLQHVEKYGSVIRAWFGSRLIVFLMEPRDVEVILSSQIHIDKSAEYQFFEPWLGEGLLISSGEKWRSHRKMIAPTFHINILKSFVGVFNKTAEKSWTKCAAKSARPSTSTTT